MFVVVRDKYLKIYANKFVAIFFCCKINEENATMLMMLWEIYLPQLAASPVWDEKNKIKKSTNFSSNIFVCDKYEEEEEKACMNVRMIGFHVIRICMRYVFFYLSDTE